ncbi:hypothetical protein PV379_33650, partial [Streptomyces caniscabiei]|uniref:hypothetical protein n=1 Tax=Streptomyces caniscabiei TaxID=2746961 RepID=UPI0029BB6B74
MTAVTAVTDHTDQTGDDVPERGDDRPARQGPGREFGKKVGEMVDEKGEGRADGLVTGAEPVLYNHPRAPETEAEL